MSLALPTRSLRTPADPFAGGFAGSLALHALLVALALTSGFLFHHGNNWGAGNTSGAISATLVTQVPLPPKEFTSPDSVLATETPSPAPTPPTPKSIAVPKPDAIPIPVKPAKPPKVAEHTNPAPPPPHPQPTPPQPNKAVTGTAPAPQMAMATLETRTGNFAVGTPDAGFGQRFAWYVRQLTQQVAQQYTGVLDAHAAGHRVYITFEIAHDGSVSNVKIAQPSGDPTLDQTALNAVRRIGSFAQLPDAYTGSNLTVTFYFAPPAAGQ